MSIIKPSLSLLPVEDIANELKSNKPNRNFMTKNDKAHDVENVAGISASLIAQAINSAERTTIENALKLGGVHHSKYLSKDEGEKILFAANEIAGIYSGEIKDTRDELYQIKSDLIKGGFISDFKEYKGYTDSFKRGREKYTGYICGIDKAIIGETSELFISDFSQRSYFEKGKYFIIRERNTGEETVAVSSGVTDSGKVTFIPSVRNLDNPDNIELVKTNGSYIGGAFSFSNILKNVVSQKEKYHMQSDDTFTSDIAITKSRTGYAAFFKVPDKAAGALSKFEISAACEGTPGDLICHVLSKEAVFNGDVFAPKFKSIEDAKEKGYFIASSAPIRCNKDSKFHDIAFDFSRSRDGKHPILASDDGVARQYLFIIECISATSDDLWKIKFSHHKTNLNEAADLQRNNKSFIYEEIMTDSSINEDVAIKVDENLSNNDLMFTLVTKEVLLESEIGKSEGVYTANITLAEKMDVSSSRATISINREGCYYAEATDGSFTTFIITKEDPTSYVATDSRFRESDKIVIGNKVCEVKRIAGNTLELKEPCYIDPRITRFYKRKITNNLGEEEYVTRVPMYRVGYELYMKPYYVNWDEWDEIEGRYKTTEIFDEPIKMNLKTIAPVSYRENYRISDNLIFEADFGENDKGIANIANEVEFQIHWKSPFTDNEINSFIDLEDDNFKELIGRVHDLTIALNKTY